MAETVIASDLKGRCEALARSTATPFYIFDLDAIRQKFRSQSAAWRGFFPHFRAAYSYKTNPLRAVTRALREEGASAEVVSGAELEWALEDGYAPEAILFDGPVKLEQELGRACAVGARVQVDSLDEVDAIVSLIRENSIRPSVSARLAVEHHGLMSRFGLLAAEFNEAARRLRSVGAAFGGVHLHVGSNVNDPAVYARQLRRNLHIVRSLQADLGKRVWLDVGGGFPAASLAAGITITSSESFASAVARTLGEAGIAAGDVEMIIEPGRSLVEDFACLVTQVVVRKSRSARDIVVVDAGTNLVRSLRSWHHPVEFVRESFGFQTQYDVYGSLCFESDVFAIGLNGPKDVARGDLIVVGEAGGYDIPSANVWTRPSPPIIAISDNAVFEVRRAQRTNEVRRLDL
jgi:diaminopimelate decarboxylase